MPSWNHWQNEKGISIGNHYPRDASTGTDPEQQQSSRLTHTGSARLRTNSQELKSNVVIDTFGDSSLWTIAIRYRLDAFPTKFQNVFRFNPAGTGLEGRIVLSSPDGSTISARVYIYHPSGSPLNTFIWDLTGVYYNSRTASRQEWMHFVMTYDRDQADADQPTFFTYGIETTPTSTTIGGAVDMTNIDRALRLGRDGTFGNLECVYDLAVWEDVNLTVDEIKAIYNHGQAGFDLQTDHDGYVSSGKLVNWFRCAIDGTTSLAFVDTLDTSIDLLDAGNVDENTCGSPNYPTGSWIDFNGTDERFEANNGGAGRTLNIADEWTIAAWVRPDGGVGIDYFFDIDLETDSGTNRIRIGYDSTGAGQGYTAEYDDGSTTRKAEATSVEDVWRHVVLTKAGSGGGATLYVDAVADLPTGSGLTMTDTARSIAIGGEVGGGTNFNGAVRSVAIWDEEFSADDVAVIFNQGCSDLDLRRSFKGYRHACALLNWWWLGQPAQSTEEGDDQIVDKGHGTSIDLSEDATGLDRSNHFNDSDVVNNSRACAGTFLRLDGTSEALTSDGNIDLGIANEWVLNFALRTDSVTSMSVAPIIEFKDTADDTNRIRIRLRGDLAGDPLDIANWNSSGAVIKLLRWDNVFTDEQWRHFLLTWNGTSLILWIDGDITSPSTTVTNDTGTMTSTDRQVNIGSITSGWGGDITHLSIIGTINAFTTASNRQTIWSTPKLDMLKNNRAYFLASTMRHWWNFMSDPDLIGKNYNIGEEDLTINTGSITSAANGGSEGY